MSRYKLRRSGVFEDNVTNQNQNNQNNTQAQTAQANATEQKIATLKAQYMQVQQQIQQKTKQYQTDVSNLKNKMLLIASQISAAGGNIIDTKQAANEEVQRDYSLSRNLFESLQSNKAEELQNMILTSFEELPDLSFSMDNKSALTFARRLLTWINEQNWNDGEDHSRDLGERIVMYLTGNSVSMSTREIKDFTDKFLEILKGNTVFNWIFGRGVKHQRFNQRYDANNI